MDKRQAALEKQLAKILKEHKARLSRLDEGMALLEKQLAATKKGTAALTKQLAKIRKEHMKAAKALSKRL